MGLGLRITAELASPAGALERLAAAIRSIVVEPLDRLMLDMEEDSGVLYVQLHPAEEPAQFILDGATLSASAKTSSAGPGYHSWLVDLLDEAGHQADIPWIWTDEDGGEGDATGFRGTYDYTQLQSRMAEWLRRLASVVLEQPASDRPLALSMPVGDGFVGGSFAVSPMGYWSREWFEALRDTDDQALHRAASEFFPAWHPRDDARYWLNCGLVLAWYCLRWVAPEDEREAALYRATLGCFARAHDMNPATSLPEAEIREMWALLSGERMGLPPLPDGIGFRRGIMERRIGNPWSAQIPGYFAQRPGDGGQSVVYSHGERAVHASTMRVGTGNGSAAAGEQAVRDKAAESESDPYAITFRNGHVFGWATEMPGSPRASMQGMLGSGDRLCLMTVTYEDTEEARDWAEATIRSTTCPLPADVAA